MSLSRIDASKNAAFACPQPIFGEPCTHSWLLEDGRVVILKTDKVFLPTDVKILDAWIQTPGDYRGRADSSIRRVKTAPVEVAVIDSEINGNVSSDEIKENVNGNGPGQVST